MAEFLHVPGFIVYKNRVVDEPIVPGDLDLTRDIIAEVEAESDAQRIVREELEKDPTVDATWVYYEEGTIKI